MITLHNNPRIARFLTRVGRLPRPNVELLDDTLGFIEQNPWAWNQRTYGQITPKSEWTDLDNEVEVPRDGTVCGTRACFAGWALVIHTGDNRCLEGDDAFSARGIGCSAREALGLTTVEAACLFEGYNRISDLRDGVEQIKARLPRRKRGRTLTLVDA